MLLEKSPPFLGELFGLAPWPQAGDNTDKARTSKEHENPERMLSFESKQFRP